MSYAAAEKLDAVRRELKMRRRVYAGLVERGRMRQAAADREISIFESIEADYAAQADGEQLL